MPIFIIVFLNVPITIAPTLMLFIMQVCLHFPIMILRSSMHNKICSCGWMGSMVVALMLRRLCQTSCPHRLQLKAIGHPRCFAVEHPLPFHGCPRQTQRREYYGKGLVMVGGLPLARLVILQTMVGRRGVCSAIPLFCS